MKIYSLVFAAAIMAASGICSAQVATLHGTTVSPSVSGTISPGPVDPTRGDDIIYDNCISTEDGGVECDMCFESGLSSQCIRVPWDDGWN